MRFLPDCILELMTWLSAAPIRTSRLELEPISLLHAPEMVAVLSDSSLYAFIGGEPPTEEALQRRYAAQRVGHSPEGDQTWLNWIIRHSETDTALGFVQSTVTMNERTWIADVAWVVGAQHQGNGYAFEASAGMLQWLSDHGITRFQAFIHPEHAASNSVARKLELTPTPHIEDGETLWERNDEPLI